MAEIILQALSKLNSLVQSGQEFPDAQDRVASEFNLSYAQVQEVRRLYDEDEGCEHEGDFTTITPADIEPEHWILDINCKNCGRSGSIKIDPAEIQW